ncbi:hypothetical protein M433DRAFT_156158 [Acidomyces richmondensis BFW]|nr:MAG: hypothetical protein FE78DRAFT_92792 [Acidomyces sp. 'richmondensis']KYG43930.1 hypothetical protein M433DRAFT_156158 [Acidomyces richmondensis BFW]
MALHRECEIRHLSMADGDYCDCVRLDGIDQESSVGNGVERAEEVGPEQSPRVTRRERPRLPTYRSSTPTAQRQEPTASRRSSAEPPRYSFDE